MHRFTSGVALMGEFGEGQARRAMPWPCRREFLTNTHPASEHTAATPPGHLPERNRRAQNASEPLK
jgi:hypothetical protein